MPDVMRDDGVRPAPDGEFQEEFVAGVREERPQPEVNISLAAEET
jgi:hypothetical protein